MLDILIVAFVIYQVLCFIKGTRAVQMAVGYWRSSLLSSISPAGAGSTRFRGCLTNILPYFVFAIIVIFQSRSGARWRTSAQTPFFAGFSSINRNEFYDEIILAVTTLASNQTGALIVVRARYRTEDVISKAASPSMPRFPTTCWSRFSIQRCLCTTAPSSFRTAALRQRRASCR